MMKNIFVLIILITLSAGTYSPSALAQDGDAISITLDGSSYSAESKGCFRLERAKRSACLLNAINKGEFAIYDFEVRPDAERISASAEIDNPAHRDIDVYFYNYGSRREADIVSKPELSANWLKWETVLVDEKWVSRSPEFLDAVTDNNEINLLGPHSIVRLLFYADPGVPPKNEVFKINSVTLKYDTIVELASHAKSDDESQKVWIENGRVHAYGIGKLPPHAQTDGQARAMAVRAATLDAHRNITAFLQGTKLIPPGASGKVKVSGRLVGAVTENTEYFDDGTVRVTISLSNKRLIQRVSTE
ncbi:MAG: hypothetical protein GF307_13615 [candidate division Zixibacteria bacterium]|nr:hypothetical protein [candidate division Zixibacteria bacterium]